MASESVKIERDWPHWRGSVQDVVAIAESTEALLAEIGAAPITLFLHIERRGTTTTFESASEVREGLDGGALDGCDTVRMSAHGSYRSDVRLRLAVWWLQNSGVSCTVSAEGADVLLAPGVLVRVEEMLDHGRVWAPTYKTALYSVLTWLPASVALFLVEESVRWILLGVVWLHVLAYWVCFITASYVIPHVEFTEEGQPSRLSRLGRPALKVASWASTLVLGGLVGVFLDRHL